MALRLSTTNDSYVLLVEEAATDAPSLSKVFMRSKITNVYGRNCFEYETNSTVVANSTSNFISTVSYFDDRPLFCTNLFKTVCLQTELSL